jgi:biopolymer transport protein ExbD
MVFMKTRVIAFFLIFLLWPIVARAQQPKVDLAQGMANATSAPALMTESLVIVSIPTNDELYVGNDLVAKDQLGGKISKLLKGRREEDRVVYLAGSQSVDYEKVVEVLKTIREQHVDQFALIVNRGGPGEIPGGTFLVMVPTLRDPGEDVSKLKPNPLTLVVTVSSDLELKLNHDSGPRRGQLCFSSAPNGFGSDPDNIRKFLECLFAYRTKLHAYKPDMERRSDIPPEQRTEKTTFIKAPRSIKYGDVLRVVNALQGAGANPIGLQIDDLPN